MDDAYNNIDDYNPKRKRRILIVFNDMIADVMTNNKFQAIIKELFIRCRKVFIPQSYFSVPKEVRLNSTHYLITKIYNKKELQKFAINHSEDLDHKDFLKIYRNCTKEPYYFLLRNTTELYNKWVDMYRKEYEQVFENKDENWRKKHNYKNLKDFSYYVDKVNKADVTEKEGKNEDKTDQKLRSVIKVSKRRFNEIND